MILYKIINQLIFVHVLKKGYKDLKILYLVIFTNYQIARYHHKTREPRAKFMTRGPTICPAG